MFFSKYPIPFSQYRCYFIFTSEVDDNIAAAFTVPRFSKSSALSNTDDDIPF